MSIKKKINLNLGCGTNIQKGYINYDCVKLSDDKSFVVGDVRKLPFASDSIDYIICDQVLEHIEMADVIVVLYEIRRVLKKGGRCIIIVPDFEGAVKQWLAINHNGAFDPTVYKYYSEVIYGNQAHEGEFHKTPMCAGYLHFMLRTVGLTENKILFFPELGIVPKYPGMRPYPIDARCRNAQLVCDIIKT